MSKLGNNCTQEPKISLLCIDSTKWVQVCANEHVQREPENNANGHELKNGYIWYMFIECYVAITWNELSMSATTWKNLLY